MSAAVAPSDTVTEAPAVNAAGGLGWTLFGRLALTAANAVMMLLLALVFLEPRTFGVFVTTVGAQLLLSRLILVGVDQAVIRLFTAERSVLRGEAALAAGFRSTLRLSVPVSIAGGLGTLLVLPPAAAAGAVMGAIGVAWFDIGCAAGLARLQYRRVGLLFAALPSLRAAATVAVAALVAADSSAPVFAQGAFTLLFGALLLAAPSTRAATTAAPGDLRQLWSYSIWTGLADAAVILALHFGVFVLTALDRTEEAGVLGFAMQFALGLFAVFLALYQTLLPRVSRIAEVSELPAFLKAAWRTAGGLSALCAALAVAIGLGGPPLVAMVRPELAGFAPSFWALAAFMIVLVLEAPLGVTCHWLLRPRLQLAGLSIRCLAIGVLAAWLAPVHGALGAALAQAGGATIAAVALAAMVWNGVERHRRQQTCAAS
jgi:O-antigen/teichoic acid export membrane protein